MIVADAARFADAHPSFHLAGIFNQHYEMEVDLDVEGPGIFQGHGLSRGVPFNVRVVHGRTFLQGAARIELEFGVRAAARVGERWVDITTGTRDPTLLDDLGGVSRLTALGSVLRHGATGAHKTSAAADATSVIQVFLGDQRLIGVTADQPARVVSVSQSGHPVAIGAYDGAARVLAPPDPVPASTLFTAPVA